MHRDYYRGSCYRSERQLFVDGVQCSAAGLGELAYQQYLSGNFEDTAYFEPFYLKDFVGTVSKKQY